MDEDFKIAVSPRHSVRLAREYEAVIHKPPARDFVVRTLVRREANGMPLMSAEIVIAGASTRDEFPLAASYPLHFRKTYFPARLHGDPKQEFDCQAMASRQWPAAAASESSRARGKFRSSGSASNGEMAP